MNLIFVRALNKSYWIIYGMVSEIYGFYWIRLWICIASPCSSWVQILYRKEREVWMQE